MTPSRYWIRQLVLQREIDAKKPKRTSFSDLLAFADAARLPLALTKSDAKIKGAAQTPDSAKHPDGPDAAVAAPPVAQNADGQWLDCHEGMPDLQLGEYELREKKSGEEKRAAHYSLRKNVLGAACMAAHQFRDIRPKQAAAQKGAEGLAVGRVYLTKLGQAEFFSALTANGWSYCRGTAQQASGDVAKSEYQQRAVIREATAAELSGAT